MVEQITRVIQKAVEKYLWYETGIVPRLVAKPELGDIVFYDDRGNGYAITISRYYPGDE